MDTLRAPLVRKGRLAALAAMHVPFSEEGMRVNQLARSLISIVCLSWSLTMPIFPFQLFDHYETLRDWDKAERAYASNLAAKAGHPDSYAQSRYATGSFESAVQLAETYPARTPYADQPADWSVLLRNLAQESETAEPGYTQALKEALDGYFNGEKREAASDRPALNAFMKALQKVS
jgi:hypothetical protein